MLSELPVEQREQIMRDSCDQIVEKSYTKRYTQDQINEQRATLADVHIQLSEISAEFDVVKAEFKGKMKPLAEQAQMIVRNLKNGGDYVTTDCFKFVDEAEGRVGFYDPQGHLLEERPIQPEERHGNIFRTLRQVAEAGAMLSQKDEDQKQAVRS